MLQEQEESFREKKYVHIYGLIPLDRGNEFSDDDEEQDFSSNEDNDDGLGLSGYASKRNYASKRDYRKLGRNENDVEGDENLGGAQVDSDSDYEIKDKEGSRVNKISRVCV